MVAIHGSRILGALQTLSPVLKTPTLNMLPSLLKIATVRNREVDFCLAQVPCLKVDTVVNPLTNKKTEPLDLVTILKKVMNNTPLNDEQYTQSRFRLATEVSKLYPRTELPALDGFDKFVVFGDSLSDSKGRMFEKTHHIFPSYNQYYDGRFTNGFVWGEYLSSPAFLKKEMVNFAEGGSTSASYSRFNLFGDFLSNLKTQMKGYTPSERDFTILFAGANDYITLHKDNVLNVVEKQIDDVTTLLDGGVKHVLVMGMPDLSLTPDSRHSDEQRKYKDISFAHNRLLEKNVEELKVLHPDKKIFFFDTSAALNQIIKIASDIGYDTKHSYTTHGYIHLPTEHDPALNIAPEYLYNDGVHPTQEVHHAFATLLTEFISQNYASKAV